MLFDMSGIFWDGEALADCGVARQCNALSLLRILQQTLDSDGKHALITGFDKQSIDVIGQDLGWATDSGGDNRHFAGHGFGHNQTEGFLPERWDKHDVRAIIPG